MAREVDKLNARSVAAATGPGRLSDGGGLYLVVDPSGAKRWLLVFRSGGRQREMGLGGLQSVSLAEARRKRDEARRLLADGRDPIDERRKADRPARAVTFGAFADELLPELAKGFRNAKHAAQWGSTINTYASALRERPLDEITTDDILGALRPIWTEKPETAVRLRGRLERVLDAARAKGLRSGENPARWRGHLDHLLSKPRKLTRGHHRALPYAELPAFMKALRERSATAALALDFLILTSSRTGEVIGARWDEMDLEAQVWTVPADRMKGGRAHRVPLIPAVFEILEKVDEIRRGPFVFPSFRADRGLSNGAFDALLDRMGVAATAHGFRSAFRDWAGDCTSFPREVIEHALAHAVGDEVERAYRRSDALVKRRELALAWATYLRG